MKRCEQKWSGRVKIGTPTGRNLLPQHPHNNGGNTNTKTLSGANTKTLDGDITSGGKSDGYRLFANPMWQSLCAKFLRILRFFHRFRVQASANAVHATVSEDNTSSHAHFSLSLVSVAHIRAPLTFHPHMRVAQDMILTCCTSARLQSHPHNMFHRPFLDVPDPFPLFCSTPPPYDWNQETSQCYSARRIAVWLSGCIDSSHRLRAQDLHRR